MTSSAPNKPSARSPWLLRVRAAVVLLLLLPAVTSTGSQSSEVVASLTMRERFGVTYPRQVIDFDVDKPIDPSNTAVVGSDGQEVPYQLLSYGKIAVETDLPAGAVRTWNLVAGRRPATQSPTGVRVRMTPAAYEITNGLTGVRPH